MLIVALIAALEMIELTGPDQQMIEVNRNEIVSLRAPRVSDHFAPGTRCLVFTTDGKYIAVTQTCESVNDRLK